MQTTASVNRGAIVAQRERNRARMRVGGVFHIGGDKPQEDPAIARALCREQLKKGVKDRVMTIKFALAEAAVAGITDLPAFRLELLRSLPIFRGLRDAEIEKRLAVTGKLVDIAA